MELFILGMGNISPQQTFADGALLQSPVTYSQPRLSCIEPDYTPFIDQKQMRRMSRILKMSFTSAAMALRNAGISSPDGVITGTGYGCLEDTGTFLSKMIANKEEALNPTPFIQSTHNTIGSQIAMVLGCRGYNQTFAHGAFSFESALIDAYFQLIENPEKKLLVGGADEITDHSHSIQNRFGIFRGHIENSLNLFSGKQNGVLNGEGATFFVLSTEKHPDHKVCIKGVTTLYKPNNSDLATLIDNFLAQHALKADEIDVVLSGVSGDEQFDRVLVELCNQTFSNSTVGFFKHLCGEFPVASAFAVWLAASMIEREEVPAVVIRKDCKRKPQHILIINQYFGTHYSLILLRSC